MTTNRFAIDRAALNAWFDDLHETRLWSVVADTGEEALESWAGSESGTVTAPDGWALVVYALAHHEGIGCDGLLVCVRHTDWPHDVQVSSYHLETDLLAAAYESADPIGLLGMVVARANHLLDSIQALQPTESEVA